MQTLNANRNINSNDSIWYLLADFSLNVFLSDPDRRDEIMAGSLFQTIRDLGIPLGCLNNIKRTLADFIKRTRGQSVSGKPAFLVHIRLFYLRRSPEGETFMQDLQPPELKRSIDLTQAKDPAHLPTNGGWGYFLIEGGADFAACPATYPKDCIDIYFYKEGQ